MDEFKIWIFELSQIETFGNGCYTQISHKLHYVKLHTQTHNAVCVASLTAKPFVSSGVCACARKAEIWFHPLAGDLTAQFIDRLEQAMRLIVIRYDV